MENPKISDKLEDKGTTENKEDTTYNMKSVIKENSATGTKQFGIQDMATTDVPGRKKLLTTKEDIPTENNGSNCETTDSCVNNGMPSGDKMEGKVISNPEQVSMENKEKDELSYAKEVDLEGVSKLQSQPNTGKDDLGSAAGITETYIDQTESCFDDMINGLCTFDTLPPLPKKVVRIFISSTFTDTKEERNAFMENVYPKLSDYCRTKYGLDFQVADMRWGVPEQASDNHSTTDLCIQEIKKCKVVSFGPNFVALVGDKYGYRPIPSTIPESLFHTLRDFAELSTDAATKWATVTEWYLKDENCIPPVYVLQPISHKIPHYNNLDNADMRKVAWAEWNDINETLTSSLRKAATSALQANKISKAEWEIFYISVTENEISHGLCETASIGHECCSIIRKIEDIDKHLADAKTPRFVDVSSGKDIDTEAQHLLKQMRESKIHNYLPPSNLIKVDIEWCISGANVAIENVSQTGYTGGAETDLQDRHNKYVDELCDSFLNQVKSMIDATGDYQRSNENALITEIGQHWHLAKKRCDVFEGREDLLNSVEYYLKDASTDMPVIIYGCSGCGKTAIMSKILQCLSTGIMAIPDSKRTIIMPRFLGTTPSTSNVHQLLVSLCSQLAAALAIEWNEPEKFPDLVHSFAKLLQDVPTDRSVILLLDSIDQLMPAYGAFKLKWIPESLPSNVKIIVSCIKEGYPILDAFNARFGNKLSFEVLALSDQTGLDIICKWLQKESMKMTTSQMEMICQALNKCTLPLYIRITYEEIKKWKSYETPSPGQLQTTIHGALNRLFQSMEEKFGHAIVKHSLCYLTAARHGLSEAEIEHILSLDDILLNDVFRLWNPPVRRIPPLLWTRLRTEIQSYIVERSADDTIVIAWYHRQFIEAIKSKYLKDADFSMHVEKHLVEYFSGMWGGGKKKPFTYSEAQAKRFGLLSIEAAKDRKVPMQPYIWTDSSAKLTSVVRYNQRKISELPFHLIKCKNYRDLKTQTFFNFEWIFAKLKSQSILQILEEIDLFMQADKELKEDKDMQLLVANLSLIRPFIHKYPDSLAYELSGRLAKYTGQSDALTGLLKGCDKTPSSPLIPLFTCFETADVGFKQNIKFRDTEPWVQGGAITCSQDLKLLYILDYHDEHKPVLLTYDVNTGDQVGFVTIMKPQPDVIDTFTCIKLSGGGEKLYACCKQVPETVARKNADKFGIVYAIDIATGKILKTIEEFLHSKNFVRPIKYERKDFLCLDFCAKIHLINMSNGDQKMYSKPPLLNGDGELVIACEKDKTVLRRFGHKEDIAQFDSAESHMSAFGTSDFGLIILFGTHSKQLRFYDASSKCVQSDRTNFIKAKKVVDMTDTMLATIEAIFKSQAEMEPGREFIDSHVDVKISPDRKSFMIIFSGWKWVAFLYSLNMSTWSVKYVGNVTKENMDLEQHFPEYNSDSKVVCTMGNRVTVLSPMTLNIEQDFQMSSDIRSLYISEQSPKLLVMLKKNVLILNMDQKPEDDDAKQTQRVDDQKAQHILFNRHMINNNVENEMLLKIVDGSLKLEMVEDLVRYVDTDRISTARSKRSTALLKFITPNGLRVIHYHAKVQVIETHLNRVEYTPKKGDVILRVSSVGSPTSTETLPIPGLEPGQNRSIEMILQSGDRIVNAYNKVKFRINQCVSGQYRIMNVPSQLSIYTVEALKLRKVQTLHVYQERVLTVSNKLVVTAKETQLANFINIHDQDSGKLTSTHEQIGAASCAKFSTDEAQLFVADGVFNISVYEAPDYKAVEQKLSLKQNHDESHKVTQIHTFDARRSCALLRYSSDLSGRHSYQYVDATTKRLSEVMEVQSLFEHVSEDGKYAIDSKLNLYELAYGRVQLQLATNVDVTNDCVRITPDNKHVFYVNRNYDTLHVIGLRDGNAIELFSCFCHAEDMRLNRGLTLLSQGKCILITTKRGIICLVFDGHFDTVTREDALSYTNEWSRAVSLSNEYMCEKNDAAASSFMSHFEQREMIKKQMDDEVKRENKPEETEFNRDNVEKPQVLIICEPILSTHLRPEQFSQYLITEVAAVASAKNALEKLEKLSKKYDAILLQLITDDVRNNNTETVVEKVSQVVEKSRQLTKITLLSLAPCRIDNQDLNRKTMDVNHSLTEKYSTAEGVYICRNANLSDKGKPISKYFHAGMVLSEVGVKQLLVNFKDIILSPIAKYAPDIQTSGNKQLFMFWSKFMKKQ